MRYSTALCLGLASGWAIEHDAFQPKLGSRLFRNQQQNQNQSHFLFSSLLSSSSVTSTSSTTHLYLANADSNLPHPPYQPPSDSVLEQQDKASSSSPKPKSLFSSKFYAKSTAEPSSFTAQQQQELMQRRLLAARISNDHSKKMKEKVEEVETQDETPLPSMAFMTPEQIEEVNQSLDRFKQEILSPLTEVRPGVRSETIKGAALAAAVVALLASKGLVITSAASLSAAYMAISQGVVGDVARTIGDIAWDVQQTAIKLIEMSNPNMTGVSKELAAKVAAAMDDTKEFNRVLQELEEKEREQKGTTTARSTTTTRSAFIDSQQELAKVLLEAETAIEAADAAIAQADETMLDNDNGDDQGDMASVVAARAEASRVEDEAEASILAAAAEQADANRRQAEGEQKQEEKVAAAVFEQKPKDLVAAVALAEAAVVAAIAEASRIEDEAEARILAAAAEQADANRKQAEGEQKQEEKVAAAVFEQKQKDLVAAVALAEAAVVAARAEVSRIEGEAEARILAAAAAQADANRKQAEGEQKQEEKVAAAVFEQKQKDLVAAAQGKQDEETAAAWTDREEAEQILPHEGESRQADEQAGRDNDAEDNSDVDEDDDGDDWLAAVELSQKGLEGKVVGLEEAIQDEKAKARWDAAQERAQELNISAMEDEDDDDEDLELDFNALARAARAAVIKYEAENGFLDTKYDNRIDDENVIDLFPQADVEELVNVAKPAVETFGEQEFENNDDDSFQGIDGMVVSSSSRSDVSQSPTQYQRDWSSLTVAKLKDELRLRGLKAYGKKTELIAMLEKYDRQQFSETGTPDVDREKDDNSSSANSVDEDDEDYFDMSEADYEELGRQARAAVELGSLALVSAGFDVEEPSDEVLRQLENEESILLDLSFEDDELDEQRIDSPSLNYQVMTVAQLREELRERGLRSVGKKAELIERLNAADRS